MPINLKNGECKICQKDSLHFATHSFTNSSQHWSLRLLRLHSFIVCPIMIILLGIFFLITVFVIVSALPKKKTVRKKPVKKKAENEVEKTVRKKPEKKKVENEVEEEAKSEPLTLSTDHKLSVLHYVQTHQEFLFGKKCKGIERKHVMAARTAFLEWCKVEGWHNNSCGV